MDVSSLDVSGSPLVREISEAGYPLHGFSDRLEGDESGGDEDQVLLSRRDWRERVLLILDDANSSTVAMVWSMILLVLITLSTLLFILESLPKYYVDSDQPSSVWFILESITMGVFTVELLVRAAAYWPDLSPMVTRGRYIHIHIHIYIYIERESHGGWMMLRFGILGLYIYMRVRRFG